jgi:hypothetical protein
LPSAQKIASDGFIDNKEVHTGAKKVKSYYKAFTNKYNILFKLSVTIFCQTMQGGPKLSTDSYKRKF